MNRLDVVGMIVPPRPTHATRADVIGYDVAVVGELLLAECTLAVLGDNLFVHQPSHFCVRADLPISARVMGIVDPSNTQLALASFSRDRFPAAAELRAVNWAQLITAKSHCFPPLLGFWGSILRDCFPGFVKAGDEGGN
jgi:hypothetical protein